MEDKIWLPFRLTRSKEHLQIVHTVKELVSSIYDLIHTKGSGDSDKSSSSRADNIVASLKDFLSMIPRDNENKSWEYLEIFQLCRVPWALVSLLVSPIKTNKEIGEESIRLFLINQETNTGCFLPKSLQIQCAPIVLRFCKFIRRQSLTSVDDVDDEPPLYYSCRETLGSLMNSLGFKQILKYFSDSNASYLIEDLYPFVEELNEKLAQGLKLFQESSLSPVSTCFRLSFESNFREFALFSLQMHKAIECHVRSKGQSLPLCVDGNFEKHPCYMEQIKLFYNIFEYLLADILNCMFKMKHNIRKKAGVVWECNRGWSYYLSVLKELNNFSKIFQGVEEQLSSTMRLSKFPLDIVVRYSERSNDHLWLLKHKNVMDFETRRHLIMTMLPEVMDDDEKLHKMLIDRSQLLTESFEHIAHANHKSLHNGLFMEFKDEVATGHGVLREWIFLVCQALFNPQNSLFLACPSDRRRFFPNPAKVDDPQHLNYFGFCGRMIALALMHKVQVGIAFDRVFFLQLTGDVVSLEDVRYADPCLYNSCKKILEMDADIMDSDAMGLTFVWEIEEFGSRKIVELCPKGNTIVVNSKNREEYVHFIIQHCFVKFISEKVVHFARGFGDILLKRRFRKNFFKSIELKDLDCMLLGSDKGICVKDWKAHTDYDDYTETDEQIIWFWKVVEGMSVEQQRELLFFWTSVKYLPVNGFSGLPSRLYIFKTPASSHHHHLPSSHTCFYRLSLPHYPSLAVTQQHLFLICQGHVGCSFGFS